MRIRLDIVLACGCIALSFVAMAWRTSGQSAHLPPATQPAQGLAQAKEVSLTEGMLVGPYQRIRTVGAGSGARLRCFRDGRFVHIRSNALYLADESPMLVVDIAGEVLVTAHRFDANDLVDLVATLSVTAMRSKEKIFHNIFDPDSTFVVAEGRDVPRRYLGLSFLPCPGTASRYELRESIASSPGSGADLRPGDILLKVNGKDVVGPRDGATPLADQFRIRELDDALNADSEEVSLVMDRLGTHRTVKLRPIQRPRELSHLVTNKSGMGRYALPLVIY
jgi:hypothetical protein